MNQLQSWYYRQPSALRLILAINVSIYVLAQFMGVLAPGALQFVVTHFGLRAIFPNILLEPWQLITYNFLHTSGGFGGLLHIAFNMLWLFWIGKEYEEMHGSGKMWTIYLLAGIGGGLVSLLLMPLGFFGNPSVPIVGASASVLGVMMAVATLYPYKQIGLLFIGVVRLWWVVIGFLVIDLLINLGNPGVALTAHWGGALSGYLFARAEQGGIDLTGWTRVFGSSDTTTSRRTSRSRSRADKQAGLLDRLEAWLGGTPDADDDPAPTTSSTSRSRPSSSASSSASGSSSNESEIDRILDKISEQGYESLSEEERKTLYEASKS